jgi:hypothetical protein
MIYKWRQHIVLHTNALAYLEQRRYKIEKLLIKSEKGEETLCGPANPAELAYQVGLLILEPAQPAQAAQ